MSVCSVLEFLCVSGCVCECMCLRVCELCGCRVLLCSCVIEFVCVGVCWSGCEWGFVCVFVQGVRFLFCSLQMSIFYIKVFSLFQNVY